MSATERLSEVQVPHDGSAGGATPYSSDTGTVAGGLGAQVTAVRAMATMIIAVAYAVSDEAHQLFVPNRTADAGDVLADAAGASVALIVCRAWNIIATSNRRGRA